MPILKLLRPHHRSHQSTPNYNPLKDDGPLDPPLSSELSQGAGLAVINAFYSPSASAAASKAAEAEEFNENNLNNNNFNALEWPSVHQFPNKDFNALEWPSVHQFTDEDDRDLAIMPREETPSPPPPYTKRASIPPTYAFQQA
ncbi:MULE domain-containing protein [Trichoderma simmonsii]|uniref:MULE domain-containing protein n=1 Tax=Trichoderma simmonsii TaxID=1491479 RepID=A0A8G0LMP9_9HYPO|nr:MULE domain-containing protein [Trichoderma simmonsii]